MIRQITNLPPKLQNIKPICKELFYDGDLSLLDKKIVAIVGTRRPSSYTKNLTTKLARSISEAGGVVISGGAMGVDAIAHEASLPSTIAVLAGSIDVGFVTTNKKLIENIRKNALVLSEYESGIKPQPWSFVHRNRLVTALSDVVVVAEADIKSGSMASADFALKQEKKLFVLPHRLGESGGTNSLLANKTAEAIYSIEDFVASLDLTPLISDGGDEILKFCETFPTYEEAIAKFGEKIFEYELLGKIAVADGRVLISGSAGN